MKKTVAIILNTIFLVGLWTGLSFCYCSEDDDCKSVLKSQYTQNIAINADQDSRRQLNSKDCCSNCYKYSNTTVLSNSNLDFDNFEGFVCIYVVPKLKKFTSREDKPGIGRGPPKPVLRYNEISFLKTERILI